MGIFSRATSEIRWRDQASGVAVKTLLATASRAA